LLPLALQRRFENVIYLRQSNFEQHLAAGLPKGAWNEKLPPGRGWFRSVAIQIAMPAHFQVQSNPVSELEPPAH